MFETFSGAGVFNQNLNSWDVSKVTHMQEVFGNSAYNQPLNDWDVSSVADLSYAFVGSSYNQPLGAWDLLSATSLKGTFRSTGFNANIVRTDPFTWRARISYHSGNSSVKFCCQLLSVY